MAIDKINNPFWKHVIIVAISTATCFLVALVLTGILNENLLEKYFHVSPYGYMSYYFNKKNTAASGKDATNFVPEANSRIVILSPENLAELSADSLATTIRTLASYNPRVIALDLLYVPSAHLDIPYLKDQIQSAINDCGCPVVFPSVISHDKDQSVAYQNSFFIDTPMCSASLPSYWKLTRYDSISPDIERFPFVIAGKSGYMREELKDCKDYGVCIPDYRWKDFYVIDGLSGCNKENIEGQIVIVGDLQDYKDLKTLPFKIEGTDIIPGMKLMAYLVNSLISPDSSNDDNVIFRKSQSRSFLLSLLFLLIYAIITRGFSLLIEQRKKPFSLWTSAFFVVGKLAVVLVWEICIYWICSIITSHCYIVFNLMLLMLPCLFMETADAIAYKIVLKK